MVVPVVVALLVSPAPAGFLKGPYLQDTAPGSMVVAWESESACAGVVRYGPTSALGAEVATAGSAVVQAVTLEGLEPSTSYTYEVECGGRTSDPATFVSAPHPEEPFRFVVVGDTRTDGDEHQAVMDRVLASVGAPDLYFNTGDLVEDGGDASQWQTFFDIEGALLARTPLYPVAGNHDDAHNDSLYVQYFSLPASTSATENWYAFRYGNTVFIVVDTNEDYVTGSEQYRWLEGELAAARGDPTVRHIVVFFHDPPYTSGAHGVFDPEDWQPVRTYLVPLLGAYGVDLVFSGHDHHYERSDRDLTGGVTYVVTGGGGAPGAPEDFVDGIDSVVSYLGMDPGETAGEFLEDQDWIWELLTWFGYAEDYEGGWWRAEAEVVKHFVVVDVAGGQLQATVITADGAVLDTFTIGTYDATEVDDDGDGDTEQEGDCDDGNAGVHPGADDDCDGVDNDCDGRDEGCDTGGSGPGDDTDDAPPDDDPADPGEAPPAPVEGCGCSASPGFVPGWLLPLVLLVRRRRAIPAGSPER